MNSEQFAYWLNGFVELNDSPPTPEQWQSIKDHLQLVFKGECKCDGDSIAEVMKKKPPMDWDHGH